MRQQVNTKVVAFLILIFAAVALSEDFHTINGTEYKDATVMRMEPDGIVVKTNSGVTKIYFTELPKDVQEQFHYDPGKAASYSTEQAANYTAYQKQQDEIQRQQQAADAKTNAALAAQQAAANHTQDLQTHYAALQKQEDDLLFQIGEAKKPGPTCKPIVYTKRINPKSRINSTISAFTLKPKWPASIPVNRTQAMPKPIPLKLSLPSKTPEAITMA